MAGKTRHLLERHGRYYARRVVPLELRSVVGSRELQEALGGDRRQAPSNLPAALFRINSKLDHARAVVNLQGAASVGNATTLSTPTMLWCVA